MKNDPPKGRADFLGWGLPVRIVDLRRAPAAVVRRCPVLPTVGREQREERVERIRVGATRDLEPLRVISRGKCCCMADQGPNKITGEPIDLKCDLERLIRFELWRGRFCALGELIEVAPWASFWVETCERSTYCVDLFEWVILEGGCPARGPELHNQFSNLAFRIVPLASGEFFQGGDLLGDVMGHPAPEKVVGVERFSDPFAQQQGGRGSRTNRSRPCR